MTKEYEAEIHSNNICTAEYHLRGNYNVHKFLHSTMQNTYKIVSLLIPLILGLLAVAILTYGLLTSSSEPVVKTNVGTFQGLHASDGDYDMYLGIPYAQVNMSNVFGVSIFFAFCICYANRMVL